MEPRRLYCYAKLATLHLLIPALEFAGVQVHANLGQRLPTMKRVIVTGQAPQTPAWIGFGLDNLYHIAVVAFLVGL